MTNYSQYRARIVAGLLLATSVIAPVHASFILAYNNMWDGSATSVELFLTLAPVGVEFESPGVSNLAASGWTSDIINQTYILLEGSATGTIESFDLSFSGSHTSNVFVEALFWIGDPLTGTLNTYISEAKSAGGGGSYTAVNCGSSPSELLCQPDNVNSYDRTPSAVPEPTTFALLSIGLAGLGFTRRRMKA
jgi:hypothetical protein